jgi:hypothetical protein
LIIRPPEENRCRHSLTALLVAQTALRSRLLTYAADRY